MTFTVGLWQLPPEYLSQRADIGARAVFRNAFPCRPAAASKPSLSINPGELASDIGGEYGLPGWGFYEYALAAGVNVHDRPALERLAQCAKRTGWDIQQCGTDQAKRAIAAALRQPPPSVDPQTICEPSQIGRGSLNRVACSVPRLADDLRIIYRLLHQADSRGMDERLRGHTLGDVQMTCRMIDWNDPKLPLPKTAEDCVSGYLKQAIRLFPKVQPH